MLLHRLIERGDGFMFQIIDLQNMIAQVFLEGNFLFANERKFLFHRSADFFQPRVNLFDLCECLFSN